MLPSRTSNPWELKQTWVPLGSHCTPGTVCKPFPQFCILSLWPLSHWVSHISWREQIFQLMALTPASRGLRLSPWDQAGSGSSQTFHCPCVPIYFPAPKQKAHPFSFSPKPYKQIGESRESRSHKLMEQCWIVLENWQLRSRSQL